MDLTKLQFRVMNELLESGEVYIADVAAMKTKTQSAAMATKVT